MSEDCFKRRPVRSYSILCGFSILTLALVTLTLGVCIWLLARSYPPQARQLKINTFNLAVQSWESYGRDYFMLVGQRLLKDRGLRCSFGGHTGDTAALSSLVEDHNGTIVEFSWETKKTYVDIQDLWMTSDKPRPLAWQPAYLRIQAYSFGTLPYAPNADPLTILVEEREKIRNKTTSHERIVGDLSSTPFLTSSKRYEAECGEKRCTPASTLCEADKHGTYISSMSKGDPNCFWYMSLSRSCGMLNTSSIHWNDTSTPLSPLRPCFSHEIYPHAPTGVHLTSAAWRRVSDHPSLGTPERVFVDVEVRSEGDPELILQQLTSDVSFGPSATMPWPRVVGMTFCILCGMFVGPACIAFVCAAGYGLVDACRKNHKSSRDDLDADFRNDDVDVVDERAEERRRFLDGLLGNSLTPGGDDPDPDADASTDDASKSKIASAPRLQAQRIGQYQKDGDEATIAPRLAGGRSTSLNASVVDYLTLAQDQQY